MHRRGDRTGRSTGNFGPSPPPMQVLSLCPKMLATPPASNHTNPGYCPLGALCEGLGPREERFSSPDKAILHPPASVPFRKFDEEVLRTLRGLRPHPLPLALDPALPGCCAKRTRGALRREAPADTAVSGGEALRSLHCAARSAVQVPLRAAPRGEDLKEAGGLRPPASFKTSPLPRLDPLLGTLTPAGGGVRGGGGKRARPFGMLPWRGREAARPDHRPQLVYELMTRDTRSVMKKPWYR